MFLNNYKVAMEDKPEEGQGIITIELIGPEGRRPIGLNAPLPQSNVPISHEGAVRHGLLAFGGLLAMITPVYLYSFMQLNKIRKSSDSEKPTVPIEQKVERIHSCKNELVSVPIEKSSEAEREVTTKWRVAELTRKAAREALAQEQKSPTP